ncbi:MAG: SLC13 family permease [Chloroflexi bacterium]|nr:SLC13 family permease [Chloroflexota bacterium]MBP7044749.1 SLC13 family permease [Chloroflexota bacterium]
MTRISSNFPQNFFRDRKFIGIFLSFVVAMALWLTPLPGDLSLTGKKALVVTLFTVIWWVFNVIPPAYSTLLMLLGYILLGLESPDVIFHIWTLPLMWLIIGSFLIAAAVTKSGLAQRVAFFFMTRYATSYRSLIFLIYVLGFVLSFLIPHPFPRALLVMSLIRPIIEKSKMSGRDAASVGLSVFVSITATSMILLTGDSTLNIATVGFSGISLGWLDWIKYMAVPGVIASLMMMFLHLMVFKQTAPLSIDRASLKLEQEKLGAITRSEMITLLWILLALVLWSTDFLHHIDAAWVALLVVVGLSLPVVGDVLDVKDISSGVNWPIIFFVMGALAIGSVSKSTGMSDWLAHILLPANPPENPYIFASLVGGVTILIHMVLGSALACMSIVSPPMVHYAASAGISPLVPALLVYTAVAIHYILPFQHVAILLGHGETGGYGTKNVLRYGIPQTLITLIILVPVEITWWKFLGLI